MSTRNKPSGSTVRPGPSPPQSHPRQTPRQSRIQALFRILAPLTVAVLLGAAVLAIDTDKKSVSVAKALGTETLTSLGLDRLTYDEQARLLNHFAVAPAPEYTYESAVAWMRKNDWRPVRVLGIIDDPDWSHGYLLVVWHNYEIYTLDPFGSIDPPLPGTYFAKNTMSSWTILSPDGDELSFSAKDLD